MPTAGAVRAVRPCSGRPEMRNVRGMSTNLPWPVDEDGPNLVCVLRLPAGCTAFVVVDDVTLGPAIGGVRMGSAVTPAEVVRLARAMTLKNAAARLPHGGGKSGILTPGDL